MSVDVLCIGGPMDGTVLSLVEGQIFYECLTIPDNEIHEYVLWDIEGDELIFHVAFHVPSFESIDAAIWHMLRSRIKPIIEVQM